MQNTLSVLIVDDAAQARRLLRLMLVDIAPDVLIKGEASNTEDAARLIAEEQPDIVFLDIEMPGKSGLQLVEEIKNIHAEIIFTTAYDEYAVRAFRLSAIDYLLKPIDEQQLAEAIDKVRKLKMANQNEEKLKNLLQHLHQDQAAGIALPQAHGYTFIKIAEIIYIKADGSYAELSTPQRLFTASRNLKYFEKTLEGFPQFVRVHRSFIINIHQIERFDKAERGTITMKNGAEIDLARDRREAFFAAIKGDY